MDSPNCVNRQDIKQCSLAQLGELVAPYLLDVFGTTVRANGTIFSPVEWQDVFLTAAREEMHTLDDVVSLGAPIFQDELSQVTPEARRALEDAIAKDVLLMVVQELPAVEPFDYDAVNSYLHDLRGRFKTERGVSGRQVMFTIRSVLTGTLTGPCLVIVMILLGKARCLQRIRGWLASCSQ